MIFNFLLFIILYLVSFYPLGFLITSKPKTKLSSFEKILLSLTSSIVFFVIFAMVLGILNLRFFMLPALFLLNIYSIIKHKKDLVEPFVDIGKDKVFIILAFVSLLIQGFINFPSGKKYGGEYLFWSSQGHDGLWHVSLIEEIKKTLPPSNPIFSGERLVNYHYLVDVFMGEFARIFPFFSSLDLYFRFFTVIFSFLIILSSFTFLYRWQGKKIYGYFGIIFTLLVGSFGYLVTYFRSGNFLSGETVFWAAQGNSIVGNPPHAISYSLITVSFLSLYWFFKTRNKYWFWQTILLSGFLSGFKVMAGVVFLAGLGVAVFFDFLKEKDKKSIFLSLAVALSNFIVFKLMTRGAESFLLFEPWWFIRTMIVVPDRLNLVDLELKRQHYLSVHSVKGYLRVLQIELGGLFIFVIGNLGLRFIGISEVFDRLTFNIKRTIKNPLEIALIVSMFISLVVPLLFVQKGIIYNLIAFMQYFLLIFGFFGAITFGKVFQKIKTRGLKTVVLVLFFVFSLPTVIGNLVDFYGINGKKPALAKISEDEIQALQFLKDNSPRDSVVLSLSFEKGQGSKFGAQPWPIWAWYSTPYISALSSRRTYLTAEEQALITGYDTEKRLENMNKFFSEKDLAWNKKFLEENGINYIYLTKFKRQNLVTGFGSDEYLAKFFENDQVVIYKLQ